MIALRSLALSSYLLLTATTFAAGVEKAPLQLGTDSSLQHYSTSSALAARETAGPDTFVLYGGPFNPDEGKFETAEGTPDFQGWVSSDLTDAPLAWQVSTFMAENLNGNGPGNRAFWCGQDELQQPEWITAPGYGNNWIQDAEWLSPPVADPASAETVSLEFFFNSDLEPGYDWFQVAYFTNGDWVTVSEIDRLRTNQQYTLEAPFPIEYAANSYAGDDGDRIRLRFRVITDGAYSDQDGLWPTDGAVQIDDVSITWSGGTAFEDFEGAGPYLFEQVRQPFAGDFASVLTLLTDLDVCRSNLTPGLGFIDYGQEPPNGPAPDGTTSTGGATSTDVSYGVPGFYIVNPAGGLAGPESGLEVINVAVSPEIPWNLVGPGDDGDEMVGALLRFDVWDDLPTQNLIGRTWEVRSKTVGGNWGRWRNRGFLDINDTPVWTNERQPVGDLLTRSGIPDIVQIRLGVYDASLLFEFGTADGTPAPVFDNVALLKYRVAGPALSTTEASLANDAFPRFPVLDVSTQVNRDLQDVAFDMARDIDDRDHVITPGDSLVVDVTPIIAGTTVDDFRMFWALRKNPLFEDDIRSAPARPEDENVVDGGQVMTGEVVAQQVLTTGGWPIEGRFFFDLPDVDFLYPGDVIQYYFRATDNQGRVTTLPANTQGFLDFSEYTLYDRGFTVRALPSLVDATGDQPDLLVVYDAESGGEEEHILAFRELGETEGVHFDTYRVAGAGTRLSNGIGSGGGHGALVAQLEGYENILYLSGSLPLTLSNGTNIGGNDKSDDLTLFAQWQQLPGTRRAAFFGSDIANSLRFTVEGTSFLNWQLGSEWVADDVRDAIGGQFAPRVEPAAPGLITEFVASGGCPNIADFDHVTPFGTGYEAWRFLDTGGAPIAGAPAAVMNEHANGFNVLFPIAYDRIEQGLGRRILPSPRALLIQELFERIYYCIVQPCTDAPPAREPVALSVAPNPFNPTTTVKFTAAIGSRGSVKIYNLRGELVRTLHSGEFQTREFTWDGTDTRGASVASGVYVVRAENEGKMFNAKVALVK
jgi:hypothetical protein